MKNEKHRLGEGRERVGTRLDNKRATAKQKKGINLQDKKDKDSKKIRRLKKKLLLLRAKPATKDKSGPNCQPCKQLPLTDKNNIPK